MFRFELIQLIAALLLFITLCISGALIWAHNKKYEQMELFWVVWLLVIALILSNVFF